MSSFNPDSLVTWDDFMSTSDDSLIRVRNQIISPRMPDFGKQSSLADHPSSREQIAAGCTFHTTRPPSSSPCVDDEMLDGGCETVESTHTFDNGFRFARPFPVHDVEHSILGSNRVLILGNKRAANDDSPEATKRNCTATTSLITSPRIAQQEITLKPRGDPPGLCLALAESAASETSGRKIQFQGLPSMHNKPAPTPTTRSAPASWSFSFSSSCEPLPELQSTAQHALAPGWSAPHSDAHDSAILMPLHGSSTETNSPEPCWGKVLLMKRGSTPTKDIRKIVLHLGENGTVEVGIACDPP